MHFINYKVYLQHYCNNMKLNLLIITFLIPNFYLFAQIKSYVFDSEKKGLENVEIYLPDYDLILLSDKNGQFELPSKQNIFLIASKEGFKTTSLKLNEEKTINLILEKLHVELDEIIVSTINSKLSSNQTLNISSKKIKHINNNSSNFVHALNKISGIDNISTGAGINKVVVRGLSGVRVVTYINGVRIENQQWGSDHGIGFTSLGFSSVELMKGPSSIMFGADALGGVLYFVDEPFEKSEKVKIAYNTIYESNNRYFNNQLSTKWSSNNFKINAYGEYGRASDYQLPSGRFLYNSRFDNKAFKIIIGYNKNRWLVNAKYQLNDNYMGIPGHSHEPEPDISDLTSNNSYRNKTRPIQFVNNQIANIENTLLFKTSKLKLDLSYSLNRLQEYEAWTVPEIDLSLESRQWNLRWIKEIKNNFNLTLGTQGNNQYNRNQPARSQLIDDVNLSDLGLYGLIDFESDIINLSLAARVDQRDIKTIDTDIFTEKYDGNSIAFGLNKSINQHTIKANYSSAIRTPHLAELLSNGVHHATARFEIGDRNLKVEEGKQLDINYEWANEHLGFIVNPFIHNIKNYINLNPTGNTNEDNYPIFEYQQIESVNLKGAELNLHYHPHFLHQLHLEQAYSFIQATSDENLNLALIPTNKIFSEASYIIENSKFIQKVSLTHNYHFAKTDVASYEKESKKYQLFNAFVEWKFKNNLSGNIGLRNILNTEYIPHLSSLKRYNVFNPGRSLYFKINIKL